MAAIIGWLALSFAVSFLLGSIPWGVIVSKLAYHKDIRDEGSGNIGTTNAFRAMGKVGGALVFVLDFGKGLLSGWLAFWFWAPLGRLAESTIAWPAQRCLQRLKGFRWMRAPWPWPSPSPAARSATSSAPGSSSKAVRVSRWPPPASCSSSAPWASSSRSPSSPSALPSPVACPWAPSPRQSSAGARPVLLLGPVGPLAHHRRHGLRRHLGPPRQHRPPARGHGEQDREQEDSLSINYG